MSKSDKKYAAILSLLMCWMFYLYVYIVRVEPSVLSNDLMSEFGITSSIFGIVVSIAYIPYVAMQIPCGILADKLGTKIMVSASCALLTLGTFIFGMAESVFQLEVGRFLVGLASASGFLCCNKVVTEFFDPKRQSMLIGIAMCMGCLGGITGATPTACLVSLIGWRNTTYAIASFGALLTVLAVLFMSRKKTPVKSETRLIEGLKIISKNPRAWLLGLYGAMAYLSLSALAEIWIVPFMERRFGVSTEKAAISSIVMFIGYGIGGVLGAWIAEKINSYEKTIIISTIMTIFFFWLALYNDAIDFYACLVLLFVGGVCSGTNTLSFPIAYNYVPQEFGGTSAGFINMLIMSSGIVFQPLLGRALDFFRNGLTLSDGSPLYNVDMFRSAFLFFIVALIVAIASAFFIKDKEVA